MFGVMNVYESNLQKTWHDANWIPHLNHTNVLAYFSERTNPFYDKQCNNEIIKMQRLSPDKLQEMTGTEYILLHHQEPILYIIRQQNRQSPTISIPVADFYIIAGIVYQAPDLSTVINARILNAVHSLGSAFEETQNFSKYHPSRGYWWEFKDNNSQVDKNKKKEKKPAKNNIGTLFQRERVDLLLQDFSQRFTIKRAPEKIEEPIKGEMKMEPVKQEPSINQSAVNQPPIANQSASSAAASSSSSSMMIMMMNADRLSNKPNDKRMKTTR
ncbi:hypothetical protein HELRODRAFT_100409 [Helobdella robusta]|uniref:Mediator of RNA polymerase II transcription subunit 6 n=1 Tax=Helobdella robusta TaxID=6412 RepID=T1ECZ6_HELRO|nr:hypothetical protein HELRODRAFT_100409 [Helobdella robusta]ESO01526.1 hypothetical protein HELRODRAFT_100409 [Helobdella robusta]